MPKFRIEAPDGKVFDVEGPEGSTAEQALAQVQATYKVEQPAAATPALASESGIGRQLGLTARYGVEGLTALPNMVGDAFGLKSSKAVSDLLTRVGLPSPEGDTERVVGDVTRAMAGQGGLMKLGGALAGAAAPVAAGVGETLAAQPLAQVAGAAGAAGAGGTAREAGAGPVGQAAAALAGGLGGVAAGSQHARTAQAIAEQAQNATRDRILQEGRKAGYVVPPATVAPGLTNQTLESVAGKVATAQTASVKNQGVTDTLVRRSLGLKAEDELTEAALGAYRAKSGQAYEAVKKSGESFRLDDQFRKDIGALGQDFSQAAKEFPELAKNEPIMELQKALTTQTAGSVAELLKGKGKVSQSELKQLFAAQETGTVSRETMTPTAAIELVKKLRFDASKNYRAYDDPAKAALATAQRTAANALDGLVERNLTEQGKGALASAYKNARVQIAKAHDVEAALQADGHVSGRVLARIGEKGYLDGPLKTIAEFSGAFKKAVQDPSTIGSPNVHNLRAWGSGFGGGLGALAGGPAGATVGAVAPWVIPPAAKGALLSPTYQNSFMAQPSYGPGALAQILANLRANPAGGAPALSAIPVLSQ